MWIGAIPRLVYVGAMSSPVSLRYVIALPDGAVTRWQSEVLRSAASVDGAELVAVVRAGAALSERRRSLGPWTRRVLDRMVGRSDALADSGTAYGSLADASPDWPTEPFDVLIDLVGLGQGSALEEQAERVWSFAPSPTRPLDWIQPMIARSPTTTVRLTQRMAGPGTAPDLATAVFPTIPHSPRRQLDQAMMGSVPLVARELRRAQLPASPPTLPGEADVSHRPSPVSAASFALFAASLPGRWVLRQYRGLAKADRWHVGVVDAPISSFVDGGTLGEADWLPLPGGAERYVADPFGIVDADGRATVLVEDYDHSERHGRLSAYRGPADALTGPVPLHEFDVHASYPYLVQVDGEWWCIPETSAGNELRALRFDPRASSLTDIGVLIDGEALVDATLFEHEDRWWILATDATTGPNTHLRGWWARHPSGPWHPHPIDPLAIDIAGSRGAGTPFVVDGELYRPAQDCTSGYGAAISIRHVRTLSPTDFDEVEHARLVPDRHGPYPDGLHTLSALGDRVLVDGTVHGLALSALRHELSARLKIALARARRG